MTSDQIGGKRDPPTPLNVPLHVGCAEAYDALTDFVRAFWPRNGRSWTEVGFASSIEDAFQQVKKCGNGVDGGVVREAVRGYAVYRWEEQRRLLEIRSDKID